MQSNGRKSPALRFNRDTGRYEGMYYVEIEPETIASALDAAVREQQSADLMDPQTWTGAIERVGDMTYWLHKVEGVTVTPISLRGEHILEEPELATAPEREFGSPPSDRRSSFEPYERARKMADPEPESEPRPMSTLERQLREKLANMPPYDWWEHGPVTELLPQGVEMDRKKRDVIYSARNRERTTIELIRREYNEGKFILSPEAAELERQHQEEEAKQNHT